MNRLNAYNCRSEYYTIYPVDEEYVINNIKELHFNSIIIDMEVEIEEGILEFTNVEQPLSIGFDYVYKNYLGINGEYFKKNKDKVTKLLIDISSRIETSILFISKELVTDDIIDMFKNNDNVKELVIGDKKYK